MNTRMSQSPYGSEGPGASPELRDRVLNAYDDWVRNELRSATPKVGNRAGRSFFMSHLLPAVTALVVLVVGGAFLLTLINRPDDARPMQTARHVPPPIAASPTELPQPVADHPPTVSPSVSRARSVAPSASRPVLPPSGKRGGLPPQPPPPEAGKNWKLVNPVLFVNGVPSAIDIDPSPTCEARALRLTFGDQVFMLGLEPETEGFAARFDGKKIEFESGGTTYILICADEIAPPGTSVIVRKAALAAAATVARVGLVCSPSDSPESR